MDGMNQLLTVNGVDLHTLAWNVKNRSGRWHVPERRGADPVFPGIHGTGRTLGKPFAANTLVWSMWAVGSNADGTIPADKNMAKKCMENLDALSRLFTAPTLVIQQSGWETPTPQIRECVAQCVAAIDFSSMSGGTRAEFSVELQVPAAFWFEQGTGTTQTILVGSSGSTLNFTNFAAATAPLVNAAFDLTGPAQTPRLTDPVTGQWVQLNKNLVAGAHWYLDVGAWTSKIGTTNEIASTSHGLGANFLELTPDAAGMKVKVTAASGITAATSLKVTGRRGFLLA